MMKGEWMNSNECFGRHRAQLLH